MRTRTRSLHGAPVWLGLGFAVAACQNPVDTTPYEPPGSCTIEVPCEDDPTQMCNAPCQGLTGGTPKGGDGGSGATTSASGGEGGGGPVDVSGSVVQFSDSAFDATTPYTEPTTISAPGVDTDVVTAEAAGGSFSLVGAASGAQWVLAEDTAGATGGAFSTYSLQLVGGGTPMVVPVVPVVVLDDVASQIGAVGLSPGQAHLVLEIADAAGDVLDGVEVQGLGGAIVGYDVGSGQYLSDVPGTGSRGIALVINAPVAGSGTVNVNMTYLGNAYVVPDIPVAPDTVTYGRVGIDTAP